MTNSTLNRTGEGRPRSSRAGTRELEPSDSTDSGADLIGPGNADDRRIRSGPAAAIELESRRSAGADVGDANLDSATDRNGTGERAVAGRDTAVESGADIRPDRIIEIGRRDEPPLTEGIELSEVTQDESETDDSAEVRSGLSDPKLW